jgi:hypothetical protein
MPSDKSVGLDHAEHGAPLEQPGRCGHHEPHRIGCSLRMRSALFEERQLFAEEEILGSQRGTRSEA